MYKQNVKYIFGRFGASISPYQTKWLWIGFYTNKRLWSVFYSASSSSAIKSPYWQYETQRSFTFFILLVHISGLKHTQAYCTYPPNHITVVIYKCRLYDSTAFSIPNLNLDKLQQNKLFWLLGKLLSSETACHCCAIQGILCYILICIFLCAIIKSISQKIV